MSRAASKSLSTAEDCMVCLCYVRVQEQKQPSVLDTMAVWYINLLAATAKAAIPVAPHLKDALKAHSRSLMVSY